MHSLTRYFLLMMFFASFSLSAFAVDDSCSVKTVVLENETFYSTALLDALTASVIEDNPNDNGFGDLAQMSPAMAKKRDTVVSRMDRFMEKNSFLASLPDRIDQLPVGIKRTIGDIKFVLMLTNLTITPEGGQLSAYLRVEIMTKSSNEADRKRKIMYFGVEGVRLNGNGGIEDMKLVLLGEVAIELGAYRLALKGIMDTNTGLASAQSTYAVVGCQGLKLLNLVGDFEISNKIVIPVDPTKKNVKAEFAVSAKTFEDMVIQVSLPAFEVKGLNDVEFTIRHATLDLSDTRNAPAMMFPSGYQNKYYSGNSMLWQGVYIEELDIKLPQQFADKNTGDRPTFIGKNMIIDQQGVSGNYALNATLISLDKGSASGWKFSLERVAIQLEANKLTKGEFGGQLILPIKNKKRGDVPLIYSAIITDNDDYILTANLTKTIGFDAFQAEIDLLPNSYITLSLAHDENGNKKFKPLAVLTGTMKIEGMFKGTLGFTQLKLMPEEPYIQIGGISYNKQNTMSNYPVSISGIGLASVTQDGKECIELKLTIAVNIDEKKIKGNTTVSISAHFDKPAGEKTGGKWEFHKFKVYAIELEAEFSALKVRGTIVFMQDDPLYGNGFYGKVAMTYSEKFSIASEAIFGAKTFRYWYVYARIDLPSPITVVGPFMLGGFGGGAYSRMTLAPKGSFIPYIPDSTSSFGVKALVGYVIAKKEVCKGDLMFEMNFNATGGVKYIAFYGSAEILAGSEALAGITAKMDQADPSTLKATSKKDSDAIASGNIQEVAQTNKVGVQPTSSIFAYIGIQYNFETSTLEANSEVFITLGALRGRGPSNRAGWMEFHMSPGRWYCYAGTPEDRLGITLSLAGIQLQTGSYFMVGTEMPTFPDPPEAVMRILGPDLYPAKNNISHGSLQTGSGFAFGLDLSLQAHVKFMILYANMNAGVGGDVMLRQYPDAHCEGSSAALGINNWYANGRVYTYLEGEIGIEVDLFFIHAKIPILNGAAAAMLEGGGPNPTWAKGYLRVRFSVLGGKVSGDMNMKMSLGDECVIVNNSNAPVSFKIISDVSPATNATEVDVFTSPQIAFNVSVNEAFEVSEGDGSLMFRVKINSIKLTSGGKELSFAQAWSNRKQTLTITPDNSLPSQSTVELKVKVQFEQLKDNNWSDYVVNGNIPTEEQAISFKTSLAPSNIPRNNIAYMYPAHEQKNVYREETKTGYIVLKQWQDYLLEGDTKTSKFIKLTSTDNSQQLVLIPTFSPTDKKVSFDITALRSTTVYAVELVTRPLGSQTAGVDSTTSSFGDKESGQYNVTENKAKTVVKDAGEKVLLDYGFGTSKHTTLALKLNEINNSISNPMSYFFNSDYTNVRTRAYEVFDSTELFGSAYTGNQPLLNFAALLTDNYYKTKVYTTLYKDYPFSGAASIKIKDRDVSEYGFPPVKALYHDPEYQLDPTRMPYIDGLVEVFRKDFQDIECQMVNQYCNGKTSLFQTYPQFFHSFPEPPLQNVEQVEFSYVMPGNQVGSKAVINYKR